MDIDEEIDTHLKKIFEARHYTMFANDLYGRGFMYNVPHTLDRILVAKGLVSEEHDARMLTELGIRICQLGGWKFYLNLEREKEANEAESVKELQSLTKKQLELSIREMQVNFTQIKHWFWIWLITVLASAVLGAIFQWLI